MEKRYPKSKWLDPHTQISIVRRTLARPVQMHLHEYFELEIVLSGSGEQNLNGSTYPLNPGTVYFITPIDFHAVTPTQQLEVLNVAFAESLISAELQTHFLNRREDLIFSSAGEADYMVTLIDRLQQECQRLDAFAATARKNLLELLMFPIARSMRAEETLHRPASHRVQDSMRYLFRHFREDVSLAELAEKSGYSANYFSHLFHESCGIRFVDFLTRLRLNYARTMLLTSSMPVSQIAQTSGFSSSSNFFRAFRKETGLSPLEYRYQFSEGGIV